MSKGFTIVELVLVLGISTLMLTSLLLSINGDKPERDQSHAVDILKNRIEQVHNEAMAGVSEGAGKSNLEFTGKLIEFDPARRTSMRVYTLTTQPGTSDYRLCDREDVNLENGLEYTSAGTRAILFLQEGSSLDQIYTASDYLPLAAGDCTHDPVYTPPSVYHTGAGIPQIGEGLIKALRNWLLPGEARSAVNLVDRLRYPICRAAVYAAPSPCAEMGYDFHLAGASDSGQIIIDPASATIQRKFQ